MAVLLSEKAVSEIKRVLESKEQVQEFERRGWDPKNVVLRFGLAGGGCSGFQYDFRFDNQCDEKTDSKYDYDGVTLVVDKKSALYLDGTTVDFYEGLEKRGFTFSNPNATKTCGCGSSFQA